MKHYLGLKRSLARLGRSHGTLLYLFWEPSDAADWPPFARHREEIAIFSEQLADPEVALEALSYSELWSAWERLGDGDLTTHVAELRSRYGVNLGRGPLT